MSAALKDAAPYLGVLAGFGLGVALFAGLTLRNWSREAKRAALSARPATGGAEPNG